MFLPLLFSAVVGLVTAEDLMGHAHDEPTSFESSMKDEPRNIDFDRAIGPTIPVSCPGSDELSFCDCAEDCFTDQDFCTCPEAQKCCMLAFESIEREGMSMLRHEYPPGLEKCMEDSKMPMAALELLVFDVFEECFEMDIMRGPLFDENHQTTMAISEGMFDEPVGRIDLGRIDDADFGRIDDADFTDSWIIEDPGGAAMGRPGLAGRRLKSVWRAFDKGRRKLELIPFSDSGREDDEKIIRESSFHPILNIDPAEACDCASKKFTHHLDAGSLSCDVLRQDFNAESMASEFQPECVKWMSKKAGKKISRRQ